MTVEGGDLSWPALLRLGIGERGDASLMGSPNLLFPIEKLVFAFLVEMIWKQGYN